MGGHSNKKSKDVSLKLQEPKKFKIQRRLSFELQIGNVQVMKFRKQRRLSLKLKLSILSSLIKPMEFKIPRGWSLEQKLQEVFMLHRLSRGSRNNEVDT